MGDPNRTFRLATPQHARVCRNTCHESLRQVRGSAQARGSSRFEALLADDGPLNPFESFSVRFGDGRRSVTQQQQVNWDLYAMGEGARFWAYRIGADSEGLSPVELQWEHQSFEQSATDWERQYSPLSPCSDWARRGGNDRPNFIPIVDQEGAVVGYFASEVNLYFLRLYRSDEGPIDIEKHVEYSSWCGPKGTFLLWEGEVLVFDVPPDISKLQVNLGIYRRPSERGERLDTSLKDTAHSQLMGLEVLFDIEGVVQSDFHRTSTPGETVGAEDVISVRDIVEFFAMGAVLKFALPVLRGIVLAGANVATRAGRVMLLTIRQTSKRAGNALRALFRPTTEVKGILPEHLLKLKQIARREKSVIVIRMSNPKSLKYIGNRGYISKPYEVKLKTDKTTGLVKRPEAWEDHTLKNWKELEARGYRFDEQGFLLNPQGKMIYSDYDIMGKYVRVERQGAGKSFNSWKYEDEINTKGRLGKLNHEVTGHDGPLFRHAGQDSFVIHKGGKSVPGNLSGPDDIHLVVDEAGEHFYLKGQREVFEYYAQKGIDAPQLRIK